MTAGGRHAALVCIEHRIPVLDAHQS